MSCPSLPDYKFCGAKGCKDAPDNDDAVTNRSYAKKCSEIDNGDYKHKETSDYPRGWIKYHKGGKTDTELRVCVRESYDGTKLDCAMGLRSAVDCPDKYCNNKATESIKYMQNYCLNNDPFNNPYCQSWKNTNKQDYDYVMERKCQSVNKLGHPQCRDFCLRNPGKCDQVVTDFCKRYPYDPMCTCFNSSIKVVAKNNSAPPAACYDNACIATGYKTAQMNEMSKDCPNYMNCEQTILADQANLNNVQIKQHCSQEIADLEEIKKMREQLQIEIDAAQKITVGKSDLEEIRIAELEDKLQQINAAIAENAKVEAETDNTTLLIFGIFVGVCLLGAGSWAVFRTKKE
jgi:hypothetical protein